MSDMPERTPLNINVRPKVRVRPKLDVRATKRLPIKVKSPIDTPVVTLFQRALEKESEEQKQRRKRLQRQAEELRQRIARRDPSLTTTTRLTPRPQTESLYDAVFGTLLRY
jgi:hypothetical protein